MRKILGLDLGPNSIGWAIVTKCEENTPSFENSLNGIESAGVRIIPMDAQEMADFNKGNIKSKASERTSLRSIRKLYERKHELRSRLNRVLDILGFLPEHYAKSIDRYGNFLKNSEPKLAWRKADNGNFEFIFMDSFNEMINDFVKYNPDFIKLNRKVPLDWTLYYLRKKALTQKISKFELAWILLNFIQKRGYYQLRGQKDEFSENDEKGKRITFMPLKVISIKEAGKDKNGKNCFEYTLENGMIYKHSSKQPLDWVGKVQDFIITEDIDEKGNILNDKDGELKRRISAPKPDDWALLKKKTEQNIEISNKTVGAFIYDTLLAKPDTKIIGKLVRTIERKFYKHELELILKTQTQFHPELQNRDLYARCIKALYESNDDYRNSIADRDFTYLFVENIIFYQRPLKSKKSLISDCPYETYTNKSDNSKRSPKCAAKSNPYFQEFRLLDFIKRLHIYQIDTGKASDTDITDSLISSRDKYQDLYLWLNDREQVAETDIIKFLLGKNIKVSDYRWNYVRDKKYPCNKTRHTILKCLNKNEKSKLTKDLEYDIWHLLYSIKDKEELNKALSFSERHSNNTIYNKLSAVFCDESIENLKNAVFSENDYAAFSQKALTKLLPLMRYNGNAKDFDKDTL